MRMKTRTWGRLAPSDLALVMSISIKDDVDDRATRTKCPNSAMNR